MLHVDVHALDKGTDADNGYGQLMSKSKQPQAKQRQFQWSNNPETKERNSQQGPPFPDHPRDQPGR
jgi:hypothetical protein